VGADQSQPSDDRVSRYGPPAWPEWFGHFGDQTEPLFELYCADEAVAARYAARQDWSLHAWVWRTDVAAPTEPVLTLLRSSKAAYDR
jgi:hypothetical protein